MPVNIAIYMHITVNGMIARLDNSDFSSESAKTDFLKTMKKYKVNVIGKNTFNVAAKGSSFPLEGLNIVVTKRKIKLKEGWKNVIVTDKKPKEIIRIIEETRNKRGKLCRAKGSKGRLLFFICRNG